MMQWRFTHALVIARRSAAARTLNGSGRIIHTSSYARQMPLHKRMAVTTTWPIRFYSSPLVTAAVTAPHGFERKRGGDSAAFSHHRYIIRSFASSYSSYVQDMGKKSFHLGSEDKAELEAYRAREGHVRVPQTFGPLGQLVSVTRQAYKNRRLSPADVLVGGT